MPNLLAKNVASSCIHTKTMATCADCFPVDNLSCLVSCLVGLGAFHIVESVLNSVATTSALAFVVITGATVVEWTGCWTLGTICCTIMSGHKYA